MKAEQIHGIWELITVYGQIENGDNTRVYPYGEDAIGRLTYHSEGYMSAFLSNSSRPTLSGDIRQISGDEAKKVLLSFSAYTGTFTLNLEQFFVTHHVLMATNPDWVGTDQVRYFSLEDGILKIRSALITYAGKSMIFYADWKR